MFSCLVEHASRREFEAVTVVPRLFLTGGILEYGRVQNFTEPFLFLTVRESDVLPRYHAIRLRGYLDISRYPEIREAFTQVPVAAPVLVDLHGAEGVDSTFLSEMLLFKRRHPAPVAVVVPEATNLAKIFAIAGMGAKMDIYTTVAAALHAIGICDVAAEISRGL